ncbi:hypothetical protein NHQ30_007561 [Ciborinia camelliae]|nr:hypothetical protein NHQ30_007561 [Ciborinia camelliae]
MGLFGRQTSITIPACVTQIVTIVTTFRYAITPSAEVQMSDIDDKQALDAMTDAFSNWDLNISCNDGDAGTEQEKER